MCIVCLSNKNIIQNCDVNAANRCLAVSLFSEHAHPSDIPQHTRQKITIFSDTHAESRLVAIISHITVILPVIRRADVIRNSRARR